MNSVPTSGGDCEMRNRPRVVKTARNKAQGQAEDGEYLPMDVYVDSESRHAHFRLSPEQAKRRRARRMLCP
jgi:hypothetical protein